MNTDHQKRDRQYIKPLRNFVRENARRIAPPLVGWSKAMALAYSSRSFLRESGFFESAKRNTPVTLDGSPLPWMNYGIIDLLRTRLSDELSLFEFGCGNSTLFYAKHVKDVVSLECDRSWYDRIVASMPGNVELILLDPFDEGQYLNVIREQGREFDVVVVDAEIRDQCTLLAVEFLSHRGVIILDDTQRRSPDEEVFKRMKSEGFKVLTFSGLKPGSVREYSTTLFYREGNCLGI